ncbi:hypothetical protein [Vibrio parahaemolyticus]|uniref:hypothetical protein n=1 Tax=Vibrio parahaemolyticus TaxID=670 RepID=UPI002B2157AA|nr:hypothetical protein [Vibrio parahaemolyticus]MEA5334800.1 hypothetical protein [Vibrio parahaemolyticus]
MADIATLGAALTSLKTAIDLAKAVKDSDLTLEKAETKLRLADLISALADAKMELVDVQQLLEEKNARIKELEDSFELQADLIRHRDGMYKTDQNGEAIGEPYCLTCWNKSHKAYPLFQATTNIRYKACGVCKLTFEKRYVPTIVPQA